ncbi:MAG TPA: hypothetical protein VKB87_02220 [Myxococcaceae bacterium]|nr:hypothetical protein [Myxococcaceae bacterium]
MLFTPFAFGALVLFALFALTPFAFGALFPFAFFALTLFAFGTLLLFALFALTPFAFGALFLFAFLAFAPFFSALFPFTPLAFAPLFSALVLFTVLALALFVLVLCGLGLWRKDGVHLRRGRVLLLRDGSLRLGQPRRGVRQRYQKGQFANQLSHASSSTKRAAFQRRPT